ncbi:hypothetical protein KC19_12G069300 [Ceratodon purpureus]|uniref:Uncharacterized protein n=1 Tax=Ceratodon purpureus TaxID=3225 RepID=A0A8T0GA61_CERPU|nr:hypothetical protein KC19_12G069300 [Ceratodon purpureus]
MVSVFFFVQLPFVCVRLSDEYASRCGLWEVCVEISWCRSVLLFEISETLTWILYIKP